MSNKTLIEKVADQLRNGSIVRVGFGQHARTLDVACVTTTVARARWLISAARRQIGAEDLFFLSGAGFSIKEYNERTGVATHRRDGYVLGHWRKPGQAICHCDVT